MFEIVALDNLFLGDPENLDSDIRFVQGDAGNEKDLQKCGNDFDIIFHLAGTSSAPMFGGAGFVTGYINSVQSFVTALEFARKTGVQKFLYASTSSLYANNPMPLTEDQWVTPPNHYACTKALYENCADCFNKTYPAIDIIGFRFMSIYGPNEEAKGMYANIISQFVWDIAREKSPVIFGDGEQFRDFTNVADVVQAVTLAIELDKKLGATVFNIGTGKTCSFNQILKQINTAFGKDIKAKYIPNPIKEVYVQGQHADISKISETLDYQPKIDLASGIQHQVETVRLKKIRQTSSDDFR